MNDENMDGLRIHRRDDWCVAAFWVVPRLCIWVAWRSQPMAHTIMS